MLDKVYEIGRQILSDGRETLPVYNGPWTVVRTEDGYTAAKPDGQPISGLMLGDYEVVQFLASGGSSLCYKAVHRESGHIVILKEFYPYSLAKRELISRDRDGIRILEKPGLPLRDTKRIRKAKEAFTRELSASEGLRYCKDTAGGVTNDPRYLPVTVLKPQLGDGALNDCFLVIDTASGVFLNNFEFASEGRALVLDKLAVIRELLNALDELHKKNRVHLDLKPENVLISSIFVNKKDCSGNHPAIILDFGSSLPVDERGFIKTDGADNVYLTTTRKFAAPEVINGDYDRIGFRSDVYSVFVIMRGLLLSDVEMDDDELSSHDIRQSPSVQMLTEGEKEMLSGLLYCGLSRREIATTDAFLRELDTAIAVLQSGGVHPAILRKSAEEHSEKALSHCPPPKNSLFDDVIIE